MPALYGPLDLVKNEIRNAVAQVLGSQPSSPVKGQFFFNDTTKVLQWYSGTQWVDAQGGAGAVPSDTVTTQAIGDAAAPGASTLYARGDHKHGMPAFGASTAQTTYGAAKADGSAATLARSDHVHGTPSLTALAPSTQAIGDVAAVGTGAAPAREDHKHAMPSFGAITAETTFATAKGDGAAATIARSDHTHGNPVHDAAAHSAISISALAVPTADVPWNSKKITGLLDPTTAQDAATKNYVDAATSGLDAKQSVKAASTANLTLSATQTVDGIALVANDRVLVKNQTLPQENGIYSVQAGAWTRVTDMDTWGEVPSAYVWVEQGTVNADTGWLSTADQGGTIGTTAIPWVQFAAAGAAIAGNGLTKTGNTFDVVPGDSTLTVAADSIVVNTAVIATVASLASYATTARNLTAGAGLTGGGTLAADRTFDVVAGDSTLTVAADSIVVNTAVIATVAAMNAGMVGVTKKFAFTLAGNVAYATGEVVTHNLNTRDILVSVVNTVSPWQVVEVDWEATSVNTVTIRYNPNLGAGYRAVVVG